MPVAITDPIDLVSESLFGTTTVFGRGYDCREVDEFLDRLVAHLRVGAAADVVERLISQAAFGESRGGYRVTDVDDLLDQVIATVRRGVAVEAEPVAAGLLAQGDHSHLVAMSTGSTSALIPSRKGLLARLLGR